MVRITVPVGGVLAEHTTPVHATVVVLSGKARVTVAKASHDVAEHAAIFLPKGIPHAVYNDGETPLVIAVHHLLTTR